MKIPRNAVERVVISLLECAGARSVVMFVSEHQVVKATKRFRYPSLKTPSSLRHFSNQVEVVLTIGRPNFKERKFIKLCKKSGEPFPVKKFQLRWYSQRRKT